MTPASDEVYIKGTFRDMDGDWPELEQRFRGARMKGAKHPATFRDDHLEWFAVGMPLIKTVLDPFAGVGTIHKLRDWGYKTFGVELEPDWAAVHPRTVQGDATDLPFGDQTFDAVFTSPVYGNRMSDHHNAKDDSRRNTYTHAYGEPLLPNNSGRMHFHQSAYKRLHVHAWTEAHRVLVDGGVCVVNAKNFIRKGEEVDVVNWHRRILERIFGADATVHRIEAPGLRHGRNHDARVDWEAMIEIWKD